MEFFAALVFVAVFPVLHSNRFLPICVDILAYCSPIFSLINFRPLLLGQIFEFVSISLLQLFIIAITVTENVGRKCNVD